MLQKIYIALFVAILTSPHLFKMVGINFKPVFENMSSKVPELSWKTISKFPKEFDRYYSKNNNTRLPLIRINSWTKKNVFNRNRLEHTVILSGANDWTFSFMTADFKDDVTRKNIMPTDKINAFFNKKKRLFNGAFRKGITYIPAIFPDTHSVYEEFLPKNLKYIKSEKQSRREQIVAFFSSKGKGFEIIDPTSAIKAKKNETLLYFKNDTHWNEYGAFIAYQKIMEAIQKKHPEMKVKTLEDYHIHWLKDSDDWPLNKTTENNYFVYPDNKTRYAPSGLRMFSSIKEKIVDSIPVFEPRQPQQIKVSNLEYTRNIFKSGDYENLDSPNLPRIFYFGDSYGTALLKFLIPHASTFYYRRQRFSPRDFKRYNIKKGDIVIEAYVERSYTK